MIADPLSPCPLVSAGSSRPTSPCRRQEPTNSAASPRWPEPLPALSRYVSVTVLQFPIILCARLVRYGSRNVHGYRYSTAHCIRGIGAGLRPVRSGNAVGNLDAVVWGPSTGVYRGRKSAPRPGGSLKVMDYTNLVRRGARVLRRRRAHQRRSPAGGQIVSWPVSNGAMCDPRLLDSRSRRTDDWTLFAGLMRRSATPLVDASSIHRAHSPSHARHPSRRRAISRPIHD